MKMWNMPRMSHDLLSSSPSLPSYSRFALSLIIMREGKKIKMRERGKSHEMSHMRHNSCFCSFITMGGWRMRQKVKVFSAFKKTCAVTSSLYHVSCCFKIMRSYDFFSPLIGWFVAAVFHSRVSLSHLSARHHPILEPLQEVQLIQYES